MTHKQIIAETLRYVNQERMYREKKTDLRFNLEAFPEWIWDIVGVIWIPPAASLRSESPKEVYQSRRPTFG